MQGILGNSTSNAYFALIFFVTNNICIWKDFDVDNILDQGYELLLYVYMNIFMFQQAS